MGIMILKIMNFHMFKFLFWPSDAKHFVISQIILEFPSGNQIKLAHSLNMNFSPFVNINIWTHPNFLYILQKFYFTKRKWKPEFLFEVQIHFN